MTINNTKTQTQTQVVSQTWQYDNLVSEAGMEGCAYLTPDSLMSYCQARLQGIDTQVNQAFAKQQENNYEQQVLNDLSQDPSFSIPTNKMDGGSAALGAKLDAILKAISTYEGKLSPNSAAYKALENLKNNITNIDRSKDLDPGTFQNIIVNGVSNIAKDLNSSSELSMINLQSLMSQRQQAIQICTNLIQSLGDQLNKIAQNVGH